MNNIAEVPDDTNVNYMDHVKYDDIIKIAL